MRSNIQILIDIYKRLQESGLKTITIKQVLYDLNILEKRGKQ